MGYQLGIDLGTTYTAAAVCRSSDRRWAEPEVVTLGTRNATVPSVLFLGPDGSVVVGEVAERRALTDPDRVVREFKRRIGDPTPVMIGGRAWAPEELSARLVRWVVDTVAEREGGSADKIAITHPASWGRHKLELLAGALAGQGLTVTFLAEPQAAALHYSAGERVGPGSTIAVYDLGGGTFDAAVVRKADPSATASGAAGFGLLGRPEGLERLGGVDFDEAVFEHVREGLPGAFAALDETDPEVLSAVSRVRRDCVEAKEALSSDTDVSIPVMLPGGSGSVRLHRSEFEALIEPQIVDTVTALRKAVASAGLAPEQLTAVLLVGGSSRIPLVGQMVSEQLGRPVAVDADPKNAIAKGAALAISPKPTASWPGVSIPPVAAAGAGAAGAAAAMAGAGMAPPARPPRPAMPNPHEMDRSGAPARGMQPPQGGYQQQPPRHQQPPPPPQPRGPVGPSHEPANSLYSSSNAPEQNHQQQHRPPVRPAAHAAPEADWEYDDEPEQQRRRPVGLLVGVGGVLAVAAVVVAVLMWRGNTPEEGVIPAGSGSTVTTTNGVAPAPAAGTPNQGGNGGGASNPTSTPGKQPTSKPGTTSEPKPTTTPKPSTNPSTKPDAVPPVDTTPDLPAGGSSASLPVAGPPTPAATPGPVVAT